MSTETRLEQIDSEYFGEEDVMEMHLLLIKKNIIDPESSKNPLTSPVFFARALDRLVNQLIAEISEYPEEMLFGVCDGNYSDEFDNAVVSVQQELRRQGEK